MEEPLPWHQYLHMDELILSEREVSVLEAIVRNYILTATPTGSRYISKMDRFNLSPATIRNVMGDLEDKGLIAQPHTSAGRIPTDKGYRYYVDQLIKSMILPQKVKNQIKNDITHIEPSDLHVLMEATSRALSRATDQLGIILSPKLSAGIFRHLHIYQIEPHRYLMNVTIDAGFVKSMIVELGTDIEQSKIEAVCRIINQRYYGMSLEEMFAGESEIFTDVNTCDLGVIRLFIPSIQQILNKSSEDEVFTEGQTNILLKPEFLKKEEDLSSIVEILEEKKLLMHIFGGKEENKKQEKDLVKRSLLKLRIELKKRSK